MNHASKLTPNQRPGLVGHNPVTGRTWWAASSESFDVSADGHFLAYTDYAKVYVRNRVTHHTRLVSVDKQHRLRDLGYDTVAISADGRVVSFDTVNHQGSSQQVWLRNLQQHRTRLISVSLGGRPGNSTSLEPDLSANGRTVAFNSFASNLVRHDTNNSMDVFIRQLR
ncbi:MAG TPA: hypothetical protein VE441_02900 [Mycobacterium sp.]|nr:hypothetical protein [Mycobacterium sp.]